MRTPNKLKRDIARTQHTVTAFVASDTGSDTPHREEGLTQEAAYRLARLCAQQDNVTAVCLGTVAIGDEYVTTHNVWWAQERPKRKEIHIYACKPHKLVMFQDTHAY